MAAPKLNRAHQKDIREKIKTIQLINRLQAYALGESAPNSEDGDESPLELDAGRLKAIEILLRKSLADLSSVTHVGDEDAPIQHLHKVSADEAFARIAKRLAGVEAGTEGGTDRAE
jgi:hypothetical protein